ncbi:hypothetical protein RHGRI_033986 [Rhododendron griersonianum]|uniref:Uncharacterized protein n=1 Tax=Rhododendron griersonianum TaxID=479676 RepID=A0AAV6HYW2_9ERIC|nr:hypothetical protein RHGRI_033986 [Rhododendron griersonianum]
MGCSNICAFKSTRREGRRLCFWLFGLKIVRKWSSSLDIPGGFRARKMEGLNQTHPHPYVPVDLDLPGFVPGFLPQSTILGVFVLASLLVVSLVWFLSVAVIVDILLTPMVTSSEVTRSCLFHKAVTLVLLVWTAIKLGSNLPLPMIHAIIYQKLQVAGCFTAFTLLVFGNYEGLFKMIPIQVGPLQVFIQVFNVPGMEEQWTIAVPLEMGKAIYLILLYCYSHAGVPSTSLVALPEKA